MRTKLQLKTDGLPRIDNLLEMNSIFNLKVRPISPYDEFTTAHRNWAKAFLEDGNCVREGKWTQSIATGSVGFVEKTRQELGIRAKGRKVVEAEPAYQLREPQVFYSAFKLRDIFFTVSQTASISTP